jgi:hypothetical protein
MARDVVVELVQEMARWLFLQATGPIFDSRANRLSRRSWTAGITQLSGSAGDYTREWIASGFAQVIRFRPEKETSSHRRW